MPSGLGANWFIFCLRSCEYTKTNSHRRTTQFRLRHMQFQDTQGTIPFDAPDSHFLQALVVTLLLDTQKNSVRGDSISMENTCLSSGFPVMACTRRFLQLRGHDADLNTPMCVYFEHKARRENLSPLLTWWLFLDSRLARLDILA